MPNKKGTPDRWLNYSSCGTVISGTRFICFKVPLKDTVCCNLPVGQRFTPKIAMKSIDNLGLVVDLTNTTRYYDPGEFLSQNIAYQKIFCEGHGKVPALSTVNRFFSILDDFLSDRNRNGQLVGVHCTHGLNRTGYFVCRYMIERMGFQPNEAVLAFGRARGHGIEREEYLADLYKESGDPTVPAVDEHRLNNRRARGQFSDGYSTPQNQELNRNRPPDRDRSSSRTRTQFQQTMGSQEAYHRAADPLHTNGYFAQDHSIPGFSGSSGRRERLEMELPDLRHHLERNRDSNPRSQSRPYRDLSQSSRHSYFRGPYQNRGTNNVIRPRVNNLPSEGVPGKREIYDHPSRTLHASLYRESLRNWDSRHDQNSEDLYPGIGRAAWRARRILTPNQPGFRSEIS